jgi:ABC-2 type transport system permease protein
MTRTLVWKILRDVRLGLIIVAVLLAAFQMLWSTVVNRLSGTDEGLLPLLRWLGEGRGILEQDIQEKIFQGPGRVIQTFIGGESISLFRPTDLFSVAYMHPLVQVILCVWAIGRASGAITGEIDRGTMELLLGQPIPRYRLVLAHLWVDLLTIPILCLSLWGGTWLGTWAFGVLDLEAARNSTRLAVNPLYYAPALLPVAALIFALSGYTMWVSSAGRFRGRVLGLVVLLTLVQFLVNVIGQIWEPAEALRPFTVFYYYQPQAVILDGDWFQKPEVWTRPLVLVIVGTVGYALAFWTFCRRDLPAPL